MTPRTVARNKRSFSSLVLSLVLVLALGALAARQTSAQTCTGDCDGNGRVTIDEIMAMANVDLGVAGVSSCSAGDANIDGLITVNELLSAVNALVSNNTVSVTALCRTSPDPSNPNVLTSCPEGTVVNLYRCTDLAGCAKDPAARVRMISGRSDSNGFVEFDNVPACNPCATMLLEAVASGDQSYDLPIFGCIGPAGSGGTAAAAASQPVTISPLSEAAVQLVDARGLQNFGAATFSKLLSDVQSAVPIASLAGKSPADAVSTAKTVAHDDANVQATLAAVLQHHVVPPSTSINSKGTTNAYQFELHDTTTVILQIARVDGMLQPCIEVRPFGSPQLVPNGSACGDDVARLNLTLPGGAYDVLVHDQSNTNTGSYDLVYLRLRPEDEMLLMPAQPLSAALGPVGNVDPYTFQVTQSTEVVLQAAQVTGPITPCIELWQFDPSGSTLVNTVCGGTIAHIDQVVGAGTYFPVVYDQSNEDVGSYNLELWEFTPATPTPTPTLAACNFGFAVTSAAYPDAVTDLNQICQQDFGPNYRLADWSDIVAFVQNGGSVVDFANSVGMTQSFVGDLWVSNGGSLYWPGINGNLECGGCAYRRYYIERHDHVVPSNWGNTVAGEIDNDFIDMGSWYGFSEPALCYSSIQCGTPSPYSTTATPTPTPTRTFSPTTLPSPTPTAPWTPTVTLTPTRSPTLTASPTATWTRTQTPTNTSAATSIPTGSVTPTPRTIFYWDFEAGWGDWYADNGIWQVGLPTSGPGGCFNGSALCAATNLSGTYPDNSSSTLISPNIQLPTISANQQILLGFEQWLGIGSWDSAVVEIADQTAPGVWGAWQPLASSTTPNSGMGWGIGTLVDLSSHAGKIVRIGFLLSQGNSGYPSYSTAVGPGWYLDDVEISVNAPAAVPVSSATPYFAGGGAGWTDWYADNGVWQIGAPTSGPGGCFDGSTQCPATNLSGTYPANSSSALISPNLELPTITADQQIRLRFEQWVAMGSWDSAVVEIADQTAPGVWGAWQSLASYTTSSGAWAYPLLDLSSHAGKTVRIGFLLLQGNSGYPSYSTAVGPGWYLDNLEISVN